ncbi:MAG: hypothetical protein Fur005_08630 [Roseiflexaceae bacterium]
MRVVTPEKWLALQAELRASYQRALVLIDDTLEWKDANMIGGAIAMIVHSAYHLGEIRQALCILCAG